ncbi:MAG: D-glycero-beta-D-manno-heptose-7-phosphate kinase [Bacteroidota bacterium]|nr:D-glycero-beta-D-manno-heptose-7-phosphate kinase [Bacteroidota bacterium]MDP4231239.1 D-glycero-beta-D-manno-heptose-7-phosphate kinase [Bacteroidota bacterium]MDP4235300.1 D-glycero-beta-D-manno-heptose-7-phosphate kinase [Bacteroidota bacterium]
MDHISQTKLESFSKAFSTARIAVIGDLMLDRYLFGSVSRLSPEAPVPILDIHRDELRLGGAANVANNIHTLSATAILVGVVGDDSKGAQFRKMLGDIGLSSEGIITSADRPTTIKTRVVAASQQMLRVDHEKKHPIPTETEEKIFNFLEAKIDELDGIIFEDYNKGVLQPKLIRRITELAVRKSVPIFVDPKHDNFFEFKHATIFKPNRKEMEDALGIHFDGDGKLHAAGFKLLEMLEAENVLLTLSEKGMLLFERGEKEPYSIPTRAQQVADVSGAGDTVIATLAVASACGASVREAAMIANRAAGIVIEELGIVPIYKQQLLDALLEDLEEVN